MKRDVCRRAMKMLLSYQLSSSAFVNCIKCRVAFEAPFPQISARWRVLPDESSGKILLFSFCSKFLRIK